MGRRCKECGLFHYAGKRRARQRRKYLLRAVRRNAKVMAAEIDRRIWEEISKPTKEQP